MRRRVVMYFVVVAICAHVFDLACGRAPNTFSKSEFDGATLRIIVGYRAGGPYDVHARVLSRYLGQYLPGHPSVVVENMPGASGALAMKYLAEQTKGDGLTIGLLSETGAADLLAADISKKFEMLGSPGSPPQFVFFSDRSGIRTLEQWKHAAKPPRFGSSGPPTPPFVTPLVAAAALGLPIQMVSGYRNSAEVRLALEQGEVDAVCVSLDAFHTSFQSAVVRPVLRFSAAPVTAMDAPDAMALADTPRARDLLETGVYLMAPMVRFYVTPRGASRERLSELRAGLMKAWTDPKFLVEARDAGLAIDPVSADVLERTVATVAARSDIVSQLRAIIQLH